MEVVAITAQKRASVKRGATRQLRREGKTPAVLYGQGEENLNLVVDTKATATLIMSESQLIDVNFDDGTTKKCVVRSYDVDPLSQKLVHVDFMTIAMDRPIDVYVPITEVGTSIGVRTQGGIIESHVTKLHIRCLPGDIPAHIDIDISELLVNQSVHVRDIQSDKFEILNNPEDVILGVTLPKAIIATTTVEEGEEGVEGEEGAEPGEPGDEKEPSEGAEKAEGEPESKR